MTHESTKNGFLLIRRVARGLRYRSFDAMIGQTVLVSSIDAIVADIHTFVQRFRPDCVYTGHSEGSLVGALAKYGILDFEFRAPDSLLLSEFSTGIPLLKELGFLNDTGDLPDDNEESRLWCLEELDQSIKEDGTLLKVFLEDVANRPVANETTFWRLINDPSQIPFPIEFRVIDACVTNSGFAWIMKHFYL